MKGYEYLVIGAGPAGVSASYVFSKAGYKVALIETNNALALKPCGNGLVRIEDIPFPIPKESLKVRIRRGLLYVDGDLVAEIKDFVNGFIINKKEMLEGIISSAGIPLFFKSRFYPSAMEIKIGNERFKLRDFSKIILAGGHTFYDGEKIFAIETVMRPDLEIEDNKIEIWFDTKLIGYYWIFPTEDGRFQIGVGGYSKPSVLINKLIKFISHDKRFSADNINLSSIRGAPLAVGGVVFDKYRGFIYRAGESSGYVFPLTGEGIRPSLLSGYELARSLISSFDPLKSLRSLKITRAIKAQRSILERVKNMTLARRRELLKTIPPEVHAEVALGTLRRSRIVKALIRSPRTLSSILRIISES